ncbi:MAG: hypothetical protein FJ271_08375 [Planctomycetes bacterium]|nr:hypothetical protein [Planctomycetota bacterium]
MQEMPHVFSANFEETQTIAATTASSCPICHMLVIRVMLPRPAKMCHSQSACGRSIATTYCLHTTCDGLALLDFALGLEKKVSHSGGAR